MGLRHGERGTLTMKGLREEVLWWLTYLAALLAVVFAVASVFLARSGGLQLTLFGAIVAATIAHAKSARSVSEASVTSSPLSNTNPQASLVAAAAQTSPPNSVLSDDAFDKQLFLTFVNDLEHYVRAPIRAANFMAEFPTDSLKYITNFANGFESARYEYRDDELNEIRIKLIREMQSFAAYIEAHLTYAGTKYVNNTRDQVKRSEFNNKLCSLRDSTLRTYDEYVRAGRTRGWI